MILSCTTVSHDRWVAREAAPCRDTKSEYWWMLHQGELLMWPWHRLLMYLPTMSTNGRGETDNTPSPSLAVLPVHWRGTPTRLGGRPPWLHQTHWHKRCVGSVGVSHFFRNKTGKVHPSRKVTQQSAAAAPLVSAMEQGKKQNRIIGNFAVFSSP